MNHSVIELAQLLSQALDENFNIKNQSAVVKVVSCLEAFNITHESYREVQNTRIIKDLQALRQNKANDQVLAKRIKNLLRKWKERLASSIPSQPNSPQNISQGSSDTQFMTQQSQSPPNSQPPRIVNGPTSFKNLLPKSQNSQYHPQQVTSPIPQKISHIHQNGGIIESSSKSNNSSMLLGKRKLPSNNNTMDGSSLGGEIDENSNHSKKSKIMKKSSDFGTTSSSSPLLLNANNHLNNQHNTNSNKIHSNVPVPPLQQNISATIQPQKPIEPKKRGRRKGSKGFDGTLNGNIPDFTAEIQQKIALSTGRRNKTTFELQQMLTESHQNTNTSWTNGEIHDSNSLDRVTSSFTPVEPVYSSFDLPKVKKEVTEIKREPIEEEKQTAPKNELASSSLRSLKQTSSIEDEIANLYAKLPPIDYAAALRDKFDDLHSYDRSGELVECTCTFREVITYEDEEKSKINGTSDETISQNNNSSNAKVNIMNGDNSINNINNNNNVKKKPDDSEFSDDDDETDDFCAVEDVIIEKSPSPPPLRSAVKSIFDPEYDANENLIEEMMMSRSRKQTRDTLPKIIEVKIEKDAVKSSRIESLMSSEQPPLDEQQPSIPQTERVPIITYECDEDPMCPAQKHFQSDPITMQNVQHLHNSFLNGINGYWNGILEERQEPDYSKDNENIDYAKHQLWKRVVPRYNFLTLDKIPKTFETNSPFSIPPPPHEEELLSTDIDDKKDSTKVAPLNDAIMELDSAEKFSMHKNRDIDFREWHEVMNVRSYNDEILTILPYVVID